MTDKPTLHPRNRHQGRYDFPSLIKAHPDLARFTITNPHGKPSIDFANPEAVRVFNRALLKAQYGIQHWDIPADYLCPPIPGRADYIHVAADLLATDNAGKFPRAPRYARWTSAWVPTAFTHCWATANTAGAFSARISTR